jgi:hypothetical protein
MTLRVVADNTNVAPFPGVNLTDVAKMAREFADAIESGEIPSISRAVLVIQDDQGVIDMMPWGEAASTTETIGILTLATNTIIRDSFSYDDD